jgi:hypothetical protein
MLPDAVTAQAEANRGALVMAVFENPNLNEPGHIAIVRPGPITASALAQNGPMVTQAGHNALAVPLAQGFANPPRRMDSGRWRRRPLLCPRPGLDAAYGARMTSQGRSHDGYSAAARGP